MEKFTPKEKRCENCKLAARLYPNGIVNSNCPFFLIEDKLLNNESLDAEKAEDEYLFDGITIEDVEEIVRDTYYENLSVMSAILGCESFVVREQHEKL